MRSLMAASRPGFINQILWTFGVILAFLREDVEDVDTLNEPEVMLISSKWEYRGTQKRETIN